MLSNPDHIRQGFSDHFRDLVTPSDNPLFDSQYFERVISDRLVVEELCQTISSEVTPVTIREIRKVVQSLKNKKAQDIQGFLPSI